MKAAIEYAGVWLLCCLWSSAVCFYLDSAQMITQTGTFDVVNMAISKFDDTNTSYVVVGIDDSTMIDVYKLSQPNTGLPTFDLSQLYNPGRRRLQSAISVCTITSIVFHAATDKFLIAGRCPYGPPLGMPYLYAMAGYSSPNVLFSYTDYFIPDSLGIVLISHIEPLPNGKLVTLPQLVVFYFDDVSSLPKYTADFSPVSPQQYDYLACIDNDNCMAGTMNSLDLTLFNPTNLPTIPPPLITIDPSPPALQLVGITAFKITQVYFVALSDGTYRLYDKQGQLMVSSSNTIFGLPQSANIKYTQVQSSQIYGKDAILVAGSYDVVPGTSWMTFVAGLTVFSNSTTNIELEIAFSQNTSAVSAGVVKKLAFHYDSKIVVTTNDNSRVSINAYTKLNCDPSCLTCASVSADKCYTCQPNYIWHDGGTSIKRTAYNQIGSCLGMCEQGYKLVYGACTMQVVIKSDMNKQKSNIVDVSILATVEQPANISMYPNLLTNIKQRMPGSLVFYDLELNQVEQVTASYNIFTTNGYIIMDAKLKEPLNGHEYRLNWILPELVIFSSDNTSFVMDVFDMSFKYRNPYATPKELDKEKKQGSAVGAMIAVMAAKSEAFQETFIMLAAADPTGLSIGFAQILRIIGRMVYFNVYFGDRYSAFLDSIEKYALTRYSKDKNALVRISKGSTGKLSTQGVEANFFTLHWKLALYMFGWILRLASCMCNHFDLKVGRVGLIIIFFVPRINLILLNLVLMDIAFHGTHSALHFTLISSNIVAYIFLTLLVADLLLLFSWILNDSAWHLGLQRLTRGMKKPEATIVDQDSSVDRNIISSKIETSIKETRLLGNSALEMIGQSNENDTSKKPTNKKQIDYRASYRFVASGIHQITLLSGSLRFDSKVFDCKISRSLFLVHCTRVFAYQSFIAASQQQTSLVALVMILLEFGKMTLVIYVQWKIKPFRNFFFRAAELSPSFCLLILLCLILSLPRSKYESPIADGTQTFGIAMVFIAVLLEYVCFIGQISCLVAGLIKARLQNKKSKNDKKSTKVKTERFDWYVRYVMPVAAFNTGKSVVGHEQALSRPRMLVNDSNMELRSPNHTNGNISSVAIQDSTANRQDDEILAGVNGSTINRTSSAFLNGKFRPHKLVSRSLLNAAFGRRLHSNVISPSIGELPSMNNTTPAQNSVIH